MNRPIVEGYTSIFIPRLLSSKPEEANLEWKGKDSFVI